MAGAKHTIDAKTMDAINRENDEANLIAEFWENEKREFEKQLWEAEVWNFEGMEKFK